jgi:hypothetical protein
MDYMFIGLFPIKEVKENIKTKPNLIHSILFTGSEQSLISFRASPAEPKGFDLRHGAEEGNG